MTLTIKKWFFRSTLSLLALLPMAAVSLAAEAKLNELEGEEQNDELRVALRQAYASLFPENVEQTSVNEAFKRFSQQRQLDPSARETHELFTKTLLLLEEKGILHINNALVSGRPPSFGWGGGG